MLTPARTDRPALQPPARVDPPSTAASDEQLPSAAASVDQPPGAAASVGQPPSAVSKVTRRKANATKPSVEDVTQDILKGLADKAAEAKAKAAKAKAKASSKHQPNPKAKAKARAQSMHKVKLAITKLGCSKCRYAHNGCSECKRRLAKAQGKA